MRPVWFAMIGVALSASLNVLIERKLFMVSPVISMMTFSSTIFVLSTTLFLARERYSASLVTPQGVQWLLLPVAAVLLFLGDYCFFSAYRGGGKTEMVATIVATFPVAALLIKSLTGGSLPNMWQVVGVLIASVGIIMVVRNSA